MGVHLSRRHGNYSLIHSVDVNDFGGKDGSAIHVFWLVKLDMFVCGAANDEAVKVGGS